jgi:type I restriction enzyme R subunit
MQDCEGTSLTLPPGSTTSGEPVEAVRKNVGIDRTVKESAKAKLRVMVQRVLKKYGYPPDKQKKVTDTVLERAELLCKDRVS